MMTKVEAIKLVMQDNGGAANWKMLYENIEKYYPDIKKPHEWQAALRGVLYRDIGKNFKKLDDGVYALIDYDDYQNLPSGIIDIDDTEEEKQVKVRKLQTEFRKKLLKAMPFCPITGIRDERLLTASHIKPWSFSNGNERIDIYNGFILSPLYDRLFDKGLITFTDEKELIISSTLDIQTLERLSVKSCKYPLLDVKGREAYLNYHRKYIFLD